MPILVGSTLANIGQALMIGSLAAVALAFWASLAGLRRKDDGGKMLSLAVKASFAFSAFTILAYANLIVAFFRHDFAISYVARYSERAMPNFYLFCAGWGGQDGSLLFWTVLMSVLSFIAILRVRKKYAHLLPGFILVVSGVQLFFAITTFFAADPFAILPVIPADGKGLNPLLQTPVMAIHPPTLYMGLITFYIPFALGMAALISGQLDNRWIKATRAWSLLAWAFLTAGNILGGYWAYNELGWGGFWAWDPVENAAFLPWLMATAFLHTSIVQERRNMMKIWNITLLILTFFLTIFGTFLTRSGLISSIHAFAKSDIGAYFVVFLAITLVVSFALVWYRRHGLSSKHQLSSPFSREASFLFNNALFSIATFIVLLGTTYPLLMEKLTGTKATVGPPFFNRAMAPVGLGFLILLGICPLMGWVKPNLPRLRRLLVLPGIFGTIGGVAFAMYYSQAGPGDPDMLTKVIIGSIAGLCVFVISSMSMDLYDEAKRRLARNEAPTLLASAFRHVRMLRRQYGGYLVHIGVVFLFIGFAGYGFRLEKDAALRKGELVDTGRYLVRFAGMKAFQDRQKKMVEGHLELFTSKMLKRRLLTVGESIDLGKERGKVTLAQAMKSPYPSRAVAMYWTPPGKTKFKRYPSDHSLSVSGALVRFRNIRKGAGGKIQAFVEVLVPGARITHLVPSRHKFTKHAELTTEVALKTRWNTDFYAILVTWEKMGNKKMLAHFKFYLNPLVFWIWFGTLVMLCGAVVAAIPPRKKSRPSTKSGAAEPKEEKEDEVESAVEAVA